MRNIHQYMEDNASRFRRPRSRKITSFDIAPVEERKAIMGYVARLIDAGYERQFPEKLFAFCVQVIGSRNAYEFVKQYVPGKIDAADRDDLGFWAAGNLKEQEIIRIVRDVFRPAIDRAASRLIGRRDREFSRRLQTVGEVFRLSREALALLELFHYAEANDVAEELLTNDPFTIRSYAVLRNIGPVLLGMNRARFLALLESRVLFDAGLMDFNRSEITVERQIYEYLTGLGERDLKNSYFARENGTHLQIADFGLQPQELRVLTTLLKGGEGCNLLFYGAPGTGKTSLARCLARQFGLALYSVRFDDDSDDLGFRMRALRATMNATRRGKSLILVDEADEILNAAVIPGFRNKTNKSWINNFLDTHDRKIIWITNRSWGVDSSTMRRFSFSLKFDRLTEKNRMTVLQYELRKNGFAGAMGESDVRALAGDYDVDAGGIVNAVRVMKRHKGASTRILREVAETVLRSHQEATVGKKRPKRQRDFRSYSLDGLHTSPDLQNVMAAVAKYRVRRKGAPVRALSALLYGPPGTGKSEFAHYLGHALEKNVVLKRVSDIESMYVGETEKEIARAFHEARNSDSILFFDEADSFFYPRKDATRSWEKKFTNEILSQLDDFEGIVLFATNDIAGLDAAAIRRFNFKVLFQPLLPDGVLHFYRMLLESHAAGTLSAEQRERLGRISSLTPGDFAVVRDQCLLSSGKRLTHEELIEALERESEHKQDRKRIAGFGTGNS